MPVDWYVWDTLNGMPNPPTDQVQKFVRAVNDHAKKLPTDDDVGGVPVGTIEACAVQKATSENPNGVNCVIMGQFPGRPLIKAYRSQQPTKPVEEALEPLGAKWPAKRSIEVVRDWLDTLDPGQLSPEGKAWFEKAKKTWDDAFEGAQSGSESVHLQGDRTEVFIRVSVDEEDPWHHDILVMGSDIVHGEGSGNGDGHGSAPHHD